VTIERIEKLAFTAIGIDYYSSIRQNTVNINDQHLYLRKVHRFTV